MRNCLVLLLAVGVLCVMPAAGGVIYNNLTPNNQMAIATRPGSAGVLEIEAGDDFILGHETRVETASFVGLYVGPGNPTITDLVVEMYRVFPLDSDTVRLPNVPTRMNSPSDVAFESRDSAGGELSFASSTLDANFTALNSVQPGGIHPFPGQRTQGNGPLTGQEIQLDVTFTVPFDLPADHYFFVPQVGLGSGQFYWLSASRPISGAGTTPFTGDLQVWTRDENLAPDWLRVGTDIVGGATPPTFNTAFSLSGTAVPEPTSALLLVGGISMLALFRRSSRHA